MTSPACSNSPELILAVCGCEERLQFALGRPGGASPVLLAAQQWSVPSQGLRVLVPALEHALGVLGLSSGDLTRVTAARGPGSFTGIRLVLAALAGIAAGGGAEAVGFAYLPLLARAVAEVASGQVLVLTHARTRLAHVQAFEISVPAKDFAQVQALTPAQSLTFDQAASLARSLSGPLFLVGSALRRAPEFFADLAVARPQTVLLPPTWDHPRPELLLAAGLEADEPLTPFYLRPSDAEENLTALAALRGLDAEEARQRLDAL